ncbi:MAG: NfeD family protein [Oscillospiraceae bacterium]|nr:NfeD family protein [Oscillospiraceae bacterium]
MNWAPIIWLFLMVLFIMMEASTVAVISLWFAVGALAAMIASLLGGELWLQLLLFFAVSCVLLCALRPVLKRFFTPKLTKTNADAIVGTTGVVIGQINNVLAHGQVKLGAMQWSARSTTGAVIEEGTLVRVDRIEGVKVFVTAVEVPANIK